MPTPPHSGDYVLVGLITTGFRNPAFVLELAAQRMRSLEPVGAPFFAVLNHGVDIADETGRAYGYNRDIVERDGEPPAEVYDRFARYVDGLPIAGFDLAELWDRVLLPEWARLHLTPIGSRGLCLYELTQRLLDPLPCANLRLSTLRQYYQLPEHRGLAPAAARVATLADLLRDVLFPLAQERRLITPAHWTDFCQQTWFPSRITFGKYKHRHYLEALDDPAFAEWLAWLTRSGKGQSSLMGQWYLARLDEARKRAPAAPAPPVATEATTTAAAPTPQPLPETASDSAFRSLTLYRNPEIARLKQLVEGSRQRLTQCEVAYHLDLNLVESFRKTTYQRLRPLYETELRLRRLVESRRQFLEKLTQEGEESAAEVENDYRRAAQADEEDFSKTCETVAKIHTLSADEKQELKTLYRDLMKLYHPDRYMEDEAKRQAYEAISRLINHAKDQNDLETLRRIAKNPETYLRQQGLELQDYDERQDILSLQRLYETLQADILAMLDRHTALRESQDYEVARAFAENPAELETFLARLAAELNTQIEELNRSASALAEEIEALTGHPTRIQISK